MLRYCGANSMVPRHHARVNVNACRSLCTWEHSEAAYVLKCVFEGVCREGDQGAETEASVSCVLINTELPL